jgi:hypothetical protein
LGSAVGQADRIDGKWFEHRPHSRMIIGTEQEMRFHAGKGPWPVLLSRIDQNYAGNMAPCNRAGQDKKSRRAKLLDMKNFV